MSSIGASQIDLELARTNQCPVAFQSIFAHTEYQPYFVLFGIIVKESTNSFFYKSNVICARDKYHLIEVLL